MGVYSLSLCAKCQTPRIEAIAENRCPNAKSFCNGVSDFIDYVLWFFEELWGRGMVLRLPPKATVKVRPYDKSHQTSKTLFYFEIA